MKMIESENAMLGGCESNVHEQRCEMIMRELGHSIKIGYLSYYFQKSDHIECVYTKNLELMKAYVKDDDCHFGAEVESKSNVLKWDQYCSIKYLGRLKQEYESQITGYCIVYKHHDCNENISIGVADEDSRALNIVLDDVALRRKLTCYVRSYFPENKKESVTVALPEEKKRTLFWLSEKSGEGDMEDPCLVNNRYYVYGNGGLCYLTLMEMQCWMLSMKLMTYKEVGVKLCVATKTIESHMYNLRRKLGAKTKSTLYQIAMNNDLI